MSYIKNLRKFVGHEPILTRGVRGGAICERNPVILEFVRKEDISKIKSKSVNKVKKSKNKEILVKFMFNLECGNIRKNRLRYGNDNRNRYR